jgi:heme/copper-type cytochrome/quinol oxidase subunit 1
MIYLIIGFTLGSLMLANKGLAFDPFIWRLLPAHIETLLVGCTVQLIMGVAFWILPRFSHGPRRGNVSLAWIAYWTINLGTLLVSLSPFTSTSIPLVLVGRISQFLSALIFILHAWPRIKPARA